MDSTETSDYTIWKATENIKRPTSHVPPIRKPDRSWAKSDQDKADTFALHLEDQFKPNEITSSIKPNPVPKCYNACIELFTPLMVAKEIDKMNCKKSPGHDGITGRMLRELPRRGILYLTLIFNAIIISNYFPESWKLAKIIVVLKPGKPAEEPSSYRPISLLTAISKLFERLLMIRLNPIIQENKLFPIFQYGFRRMHAITEQAHSVAKLASIALEDKSYCCGVFLDVAQAFDRVWHDGLLHKLQLFLPLHYVKVFESYLTNRKFYVCFNEFKSSIHKIRAGVPQGSVVGPVLYNLYTADIPISDHVENSVFADDTAILTNDKDLNTATNRLQKHIDKLSSWTTQWKIALNTNKSVHINFTLRKEKPIPLVLHGAVIPYQTTVKYLGVHFDQRLTWRDHIMAKTKTAGLKFRAYYWLMGKHSSLSLENKRLMYMMIIRPTWSYAAPVWSTASQSNINILERRQNITIRSMVNVYRYTKNADLLNDFNIPTARETIRSLSDNYEQRLHKHPNTRAIELLDSSSDTHRLKRPRLLF